MYKKVIIITLVILSLFIFKPCNIYALQNKKAENNSLIEINITQKLADKVDKCYGGSTSLLGDPEDENSVAWLIQKVLNYVKIAGPMLVLIFSCIDFLKLIVQSDAESMSKVQKKLFTRLALAILLFFVPDLVNALLALFGMTNSQTCGLQ